MVRTRRNIHTVVADAVTHNDLTLLKPLDHVPGRAKSDQKQCLRILAQFDIFLIIPRIADHEVNSGVRKDTRFLIEAFEQIDNFAVNNNGFHSICTFLGYTFVVAKLEAARFQRYGIMS